MPCLLLPLLWGLQEDAVCEARTKLQGLQKEKDDLEASKDILRQKIAKVGQHMASLLFLSYSR
jgi:hypothetical protein